MLIEFFSLILLIIFNILGKKNKIFLKEYIGAVQTNKKDNNKKITIKRWEYWIKL